MTPYFLTGEDYDLQIQGYREDLKFYLSEIKKSKNTLEIGCGTGRILLPALKAGANIEGLDFSKKMLKTLHQKAKRIGLKPVTYYADMRNFTLGKKYGLIIVPFRPFQHLYNTREQIAALKNFHKHLNRGGKLILNIFNPDYLRMTRSGQKEFYAYVRDPLTKNKVKISAINYYYPAEQLLKVTFIHEELDKHNLLVGKKEYKTTLRYIFRFEFEHLLALSSFKVIKLYGDFKRGKFRDFSREMVWVCQKT